MRGKKRLYARNIYTCKSWKLKEHIYIHGYVVGKLGILSINGFPNEAVFHNFSQVSF